MAQLYVMKDRSRNADGHKEMSHMIRDPRQKAGSAQYLPKKRTMQKSNLVSSRSKRDSKRKILSVNDKGVRRRLLRSHLRARGV